MVEDYSKVCSHGSLERACPICELESGVKILTWEKAKLLSRTYVLEAKISQQGKVIKALQEEIRNYRQAT